MKVSREGLSTDGRSFPTRYHVSACSCPHPLWKKKLALLCFASTALLVCTSTAHLHSTAAPRCSPALRIRPPPPHRAAHSPRLPPPSLHDECSSKQARGEASCDAAPHASWSRRCSTGELHALPPTSPLALSSETTSLYSSKQQGGIVLSVYVASICFKCFICFRSMLQVFHMDVAKVDRDVAHGAMDIHVCCKCMFQMFHLFSGVCL
jgi:hypothetical protein